jgi:hypothetical protein
LGDLEPPRLKRLSCEPKNWEKVGSLVGDTGVDVLFSAWTSFSFEGRTLDDTGVDVLFSAWTSFSFKGRTLDGGSGKFTGPENKNYRLLDVSLCNTDIFGRAHSSKSYWTSR